MKRLLILGGTGDAVKLAAQTVLISGLETITSLAGRTSEPSTVTGVIRVGGFGGEAGLVEYLRSNSIDLLIDATHPFAAQISGNAAKAATTVGIPLLMLVRPAWERLPLDRWIEVESITFCHFNRSMVFNALDRSTCRRSATTTRENVTRSRPV
jgi:precorrin-6A/cobalt-precorrin-6A reductase